MLQNDSRFVGLDAFGHHVNNVVHDRRTELQIKVTLHALLGYPLGRRLVHSALELAGKEVA